MSFLLCLEKEGNLRFSDVQNLLLPTNEVAGRECFRSYLSVCLSTGVGVPMWPLLMLPWTLPYRDPFPSLQGPLAPPPPLYRDPCLPALVLALDPLVVTPGGQDCRPVQTCSLEDPTTSNIWWPRPDAKLLSCTVRQSRHYGK